MATASHQESFQQVCIRTLREDGARITNARVAVIEALAESSKPLTPKDLLQEVLARSPDTPVDLVSVYRTLDKLSGLALVHEMGSSGGFLPCRHSACGHDLHIILRCTRCSTTIEHDVNEPAVTPLVRFIQEDQKFKITGPAFQVDGICEDCNGG